MNPKTITAWREALGGRRFLLCVGCAFINALLVTFRVIDPSIYRDLILATVAVFVAGNTYQKVKTSPQGKDNE